MTHTRPLPDDDDAAAELLAAELEARALRDPALRRLILRRLASEDDQPFKAPCEMTLDELAARHATDRFTLGRVAAKAIRKLRFIPEVRCLKPQS